MGYCNEFILIIASLSYSVSTRTYRRVYVYYLTVADKESPDPHLWQQQIIYTL